LELTKNEKKTLKLLLDNSRITDSEVAMKLDISSQAVGKIRRKLETTVIESYTVNLNYYKLGIQIFAIAIAKLTKEGLDKGQLEVENELLNIAHVINVYRVPKLSATHIILYGFKDMNELDGFFYSPKMRQQLHNYIETQELFTFSHNSLIKKSPIQLFRKVIDELGIKSSEVVFEEIETFKRKVSLNPRHKIATAKSGMQS
jgi:DNA-binding Lrp family transcriptional regulator